MEDFQAMRAFSRVAELGSFTRAADELGLSRAMVSTHVHRLEKRFGLRLLNRTTRKVALTPAGSDYLGHCRRVFAELTAAEETLRRSKEQPTGRLRVDVPGSFGRHILLPRLPEFLARYPLVQLELLPTDRVLDMVDEGIDVALRIGRLADTSFMARKIGEDKRLICAAPSYLARHGTPQVPEDLRRHNCIVSRDHPYLNRWSFKVDGQIVEIDVRGRVAVTEGEAQMQLALQGIGIVRLTRLTLTQAIREGTLVPLLGSFSAEEAVAIHAVYPHRRHLAPKVPAFVNFLIDKFTPPPWEL